MVPPPGFGPPGGLFPGNQGQSAQNESDRRIDVRGNLELTARPELLPGWRVAPNLVSQVTIGDASISILGMTINLSNEMKPTLERTINEQVSSLQKQLADSSMVEVEVWGRAIRSSATPDLGLWVAREIGAETEHAPLIEDVAAASSATQVDGTRVGLNDHWQIAQIGAAESILRDAPDQRRTHQDTARLRGRRRPAHRRRRRILLHCRKNYRARRIAAPACADWA